MMRWTIVTMISFCILAAGCGEEQKQCGPDEGRLNESLITSLNDLAIQNAIISQHTLFPYHFLNDSERLNELGQRDLGVLVKHFRENPGRLNIRQDNTPAQLYEARVNFVLNECQNTGLDTAKIQLADDLAGGPGLPSEKVVVIMKDTSRPASSRSGAMYAAPRLSR